MKNKVLDKVKWLQTNKETTFIQPLGVDYNENETLLFFFSFIEFVDLEVEQREQTSSGT